MKRDYIVLDIKSPNARGNSICSIGVIVVRNGEVVHNIYSLINPEDRFDRNSYKITGIDAKMVIKAPTLKEYWKKISEYFTLTVLGHNIRYDLSVLAKALARYDIKAPEFTYVCTLELSIAHLSMSSYKIGSLMNIIGAEYKTKSELADAKAAYELFVYLVDHCKLDRVETSTYVYENKLQSMLEEKLTTSINELYGAIIAIAYDNIVDVKEIEYLKTWCKLNYIYREYPVFSRILETLDRILEDGIVDHYEKMELIAVIESVRNADIYNDAMLSIQILRGLLSGIVCDMEINKREVESLREWLNHHDYLAGVYPYDKITSCVNKVLEDGILTEQEEKELYYEFDEVLAATSSIDSMELENKTFCLTGKFVIGDESDICDKLVMKGAIMKKKVYQDLDYLFVASKGNEARKFGLMGNKLAKAEELNEKGSSIKIISEEELVKLL